MSGAVDRIGQFQQEIINLEAYFRQEIDAVKEKCEVDASPAEAQPILQTLDRLSNLMSRVIRLNEQFSSRLDEMRKEAGQLLFEIHYGPNKDELVGMGDLADKTDGFALLHRSWQW